MADRVLMVTWGENIAGREERGLEVFNEVLGLYGRMQQEDRIERFEVCIMTPGAPFDGYVALHGTADQLNEVRESEDYRRSLIDATLVCHDICECMGTINQGVAREVEMYREALADVPQAA
jgi:hypothetical protein